MLSTLMHPHPQAPALDLQGKSLAGAYFFSPWVTFDGTAASMRLNKSKDFFDQEQLEVASAHFMGVATVDRYNTPLTADADWWRGMPIKDICVLCGQYEIFLDDIKTWVDKVKVRTR